MPRTANRRLQTVLLAALACGTAAAAQQKPGQLPRPTFSSSVDIVSVDVNVIDRNGRPVRDLSAADFTLSVDGRPRKIASAQFISVTAPETAAGPPPSHYTTNVSASNGRLIVIVVDRGSIAPVRSKDVLAAAARFVDRLAPADRVALYSIPSGPAVDFTTDHGAIVSALVRTDGQANPGPGGKNIGIAEAVGFERGNRIVMETVFERECGATPGRGGGGSEHLLCTKLIREEAGIVAAYARERAQNTIAGLRAIVERFGASDTPKTLVLISEGLVIDGERFAATGLARALAASHATIYALKPEPSDSDASQARAPQNRARDRAVYEDGLINIEKSRYETRRYKWPAACLTVNFSGNGRFLASGMADGSLHFWNRSTGKDSQMRGYDGRLELVGWSDNSRYLASSAGNELVLWDFGGKGPEGTKPIVLNGHTERVDSFAWQPGGEHLVSGGRDWRIALWRPGKSREAIDVQMLDSEVTALRWSPDGKFLVAGEKKGRLTVYQLVTR